MHFEMVLFMEIRHVSDFDVTNFGKAQHSTLEDLITPVKIFILVNCKELHFVMLRFYCFSLTIVVPIKIYVNDNNSLKHYLSS